MNRFKGKSVSEKGKRRTLLCEWQSCKIGCLGRWIVIKHTALSFNQRFSLFLRTSCCEPSVHGKWNFGWLFWRNTFI